MTNSEHDRFLYDIDMAEIDDSESDTVSVNLTLYYRTYSIDEEGAMEITGSGEDVKEIELPGAFKLLHRDDPVEV